MPDIIKHYMDEIVRGPQKKILRSSNLVQHAFRKYHEELKSNKKSYYEIMGEIKSVMQSPKVSNSVFWPVYLAVINYDRLFCGNIIGRVRVTGSIDDILGVKNEAAIALLPNHLDMLDTLITGYLNHSLGFKDGVIQAGMNLQTPGLGTAGRHLGLFWVKRSNYSPLDVIGYHASVHQLIENKQAQWVYIEGTRSRTGKMAPALNKVWRFFNKRKVPQKPLKPGFTMAMLYARRHVKHPIYVVPVNYNIPLVYDHRDASCEGEEGEKLHIFRRYTEAMKYLNPVLPEIEARFGEPYKLPEMDDDRANADKFHRWLKDAWKKNMPVLPLNLMAYTMIYIDKEKPDFNDLPRGKRAEFFETVYSRFSDALNDKCVHFNSDKYDASLKALHDLDLLRNFRINITQQVEYSSNLIEHHLRNIEPLRKK